MYINWNIDFGNDPKNKPLRDFQLCTYLFWSLITLILIINQIKKGSFIILGMLGFLFLFQLFLEIVDAGMPAPLAGGDNGVSKNPDGSTYPSPTPYQLWDEPVPGYAKPATGVINEIKTMLSDLFRVEFQDAIQSSKAEILQLVKEYAAERIRSATGG